MASTYPHYILNGMTVSILKDNQEIAVVNFDHRDVIRHPLVTKIVKAYHKNNNDKG